MLSIENLHASVAGKPILKGLSMDVPAGQVHAIMGPNGSGKSTLSRVICGHPDYVVTAGTVRYDGEDLLALPPEERARKGIFLSFQYPVEIPGISVAFFLRSAWNAQRKSRGQPEVDAMDFLKIAKEKAKLVDLPAALLNRPLNVGFSGGEKKRVEIFQMTVLEPRLAILDETDSGLDIDALRVIAAGINAMRTPDRAQIVITHYQRLLDHIVPDVTHVLLDGRIVKTGGKELAFELEEKGYDWVKREAGAAV